MTSPKDRRVARARAQAAAVAGCAVALRRLAAGVMPTSRGRGELDVAMAGLMEALSRSLREQSPEVQACALRVVVAPRTRPATDPAAAASRSDVG